MNPPPRSYRYYDLVMAAFVCVLLCSNLIGAAKAAQVTLPLLGEVTFSAGVLFFPISYIFGDILTEVYGYGRDRRVVWAGFAALAFAAFMAWVALALPAGAGRLQPGLPGAHGRRLRQHLAHRRRLDDSLLVRQLRQQLRHGENEGVDAEPGCGCAPSARPWSAKR